jgi:hypothetical protein
VAISYRQLRCTPSTLVPVLLYASVLLQPNTQLNSSTELNSQLLFASRYIDLGRISRKTRVTCHNTCSLAHYRALGMALNTQKTPLILVALPSNGLFTKNLSPRDRVYRAVGRYVTIFYNLLHVNNKACYLVKKDKPSTHNRTKLDLCRLQQLAFLPKQYCALTSCSSGEEYVDLFSRQIYLIINTKSSEIKRNNCDKTSVKGSDVLLQQEKFV